MKDRIDMTIDPHSAGQKPDTSNPGTKPAASAKKPALMSRVSRPSVRTCRHPVNRFTMGRRMALMNPSTAAAMRTAPASLACSPGTIFTVR
jgi:hypothetical protein